MRKKPAALLLILAALLGLTACSGQIASTNTPAPANTAAKISVSVTFNAMKEFAKAVGGDKVEITTIIPDGMEPHDFEPKAQDLIVLSKAQVFVYNGLGMESWVESTLAAVGNKNLVAVDASVGVTPITNTDVKTIGEHGRYDPHIWLSLKCAETQVKNIKDGLIKADPANKDYYERNCTDYVSQLESLYNEYSAKFKLLIKNSFVTGHAAFAYLCRDFGLSQNSVEDVFAEGEPSAQQLIKLVEYCKKNNVTTVFAEEMASPDVSKTLASEVGAKVETIYTLESAEDNKTYLERMRDNLSKIYASLTGNAKT